MASAKRIATGFIRDGVGMAIGVFVLRRKSVIARSAHCDWAAEWRWYCVRVDPERYRRECSGDDWRRWASFTGGSIRPLGVPAHRIRYPKSLPLKIQCPTPILRLQGLPRRYNAPLRTITSSFTISGFLNANSSTRDARFRRIGRDTFA